MNHAGSWGNRMMFYQFYRRIFDASDGSDTRELVLIEAASSLDALHIAMDCGCSSADSGQKPGIKTVEIRYASGDISWLYSER